MEDQPALSDELAPPAAAEGGGAYRVLARKYRPATFAELIGQDAMVRTLNNAIAQNRVAHAFLLTGVRGIGKTTTARIIARALNCIGPDGSGGPTVEPCGACEHCVAIAEDRHVDVMEMDAASRTGVADIRELIDGVRYRPVSARRKVYIIDEVHMLSTAAFNALLKTLEEPPEHVTFIFATTEIRKVPVTVLSRCQRFDLRRIDMAMMAEHLSGIARKESAELSEGAARLLARAADGSVRDGLSLLDQAIAMAEGSVVEETAVRAMLGLADRALVFDLMQSALQGDAPGCLDQMADMYRAGADPAVVVGDLLELTHLLTRIKVNPQAASDPMMAEPERVRGAEMADALSMGQLARAWQLLLSAHAEVQAAPNPQQAAEMALIRLCYVTDLPTPAQLIEAVQAARPAAGGEPRETVPSDAPGGGSGPASGPPAPSDPVAVASPVSSSPVASAALATSPAAADPEPTQAHAALPDPQSFAEVIALFEENREGVLCAHLKNNVHLVQFAPGMLEFRPAPDAPPRLANDLRQCLDKWTGRKWSVAVSQAEGDPTLTQQQQAEEDALRAEITAHPDVQKILNTFPGAQIGEIRTIRGDPGMDPFDADAQDADPEDDPDDPAEDTDHDPDLRAGAGPNDLEDQKQ
ncbi:MAG: DNA polymerase III subunit gamma/tau [Alphaproteobacteria bacterium]|nr:DNA polymerase III subunit gamma/tau [Alphaproteobacteria bacterium]